jgi:hypothetical protein
MAALEKNIRDQVQHIYMRLRDLLSEDIYNVQWSMRKVGYNPCNLDISPDEFAIVIPRTRDKERDTDIIVEKFPVSHEGIERAAAVITLVFG